MDEEKTEYPVTNPNIKHGHIAVPIVQGHHTHTRGLFQRVLSFKQAALFMLMHFLVISVVQGYFYALRLILRSRGGSYEDQATLSISDYPYTFKFLLAPILDRYYLSRVGRSRTYLLSTAAILALSFIGIGPIIEEMLDEKRITALFVINLGVNIVVCVAQIAGESWVLTLFKDEDEKSKASTFINVGYNIGYVLGFNIFIPLNDLEFLNTTFFKNHPLSHPLVENIYMCYFISLLFLLEFLTILLFISEKRAENNPSSLLQIIKIIPKHFTNKNMRSLIVYFFITSFVYYSVDQSFDYMLVQNGVMNMSPSTISNIDTVLYPVLLVISLGTVYFMKTGQLLKMYHLNLIVVLLTATYRYFMVVDLLNNANEERTIIARSYASILYGMDFTSFFLMGYFNTIVSEEVGNTGITCLIALMNWTTIISSTVGFALLEYIDFTILVPIVIILQGIILVFTYNMGRRIDAKPAHLFDLSDNPKDNNKETEEINTGSVQTRESNATLALTQ